MIGDYYRSNRYVEQENQERQKYEKKWSKSEKMLLGIIILGLLGIIVKYVLL
jgi:cell division protein FtsL